MKAARAKTEYCKKHYNRKPCGLCATEDVRVDLSSANFGSRMRKVEENIEALRRARPTLDVVLRENDSI